MKRVIVILSSTVIMGCTATGVVPMGQDTFMIGRQGSALASTSALKGESFKEASEYCSKSGKAVFIVNTREVPGGFGRLAESEIQFRCLEPGNPALQQSTLQPVPNVVIENRTK